MGLLTAASSARDDAVVESTHDEQARGWRRWLIFLARIGIPSDPYLDDFDPPSRLRLLGAFAESVRVGDYADKRPSQPYVAATAKKYVDQVGKTFLGSHRPDPRLDPSGNTSALLQRQFRGYKNSDKPSTGQKALPPSVLIRMFEVANSPTTLLLSNLAIAAFFHAMRSCEYLVVPGDRRTSPLLLQDVSFYSASVLLLHDSPQIAQADAVTIRFRWQKTDVRQATITMYRTDDPILCPIRAWAAIIRHVRHLPGASDSTLVCAASRAPSGSFQLLTGSDMVTLIRAAVADLGHTSLGFTPADVGTHSIRSGAAMAMHLAGVAVYTIMLIGRWRSDAFMRYLRPQVLQFTHQVSRRMVDVNHFFHVPSSRDAFESPATHPSSSPRLRSLHLAGNSDRVLPQNPFKLPRHGN